MRKLTIDIDDATYAYWEQNAAARGLSVGDWLKSTLDFLQPIGDRSDKSIELLTVAERLARLREFEATLVGHGGTAEFDRADLYD